MSYEKYIKRNGKLYGPYTYHSRRVNGKVVSEYHGPKKTKKHHIINNKKKIIYYIALLAILVLLSWILFFNAQITGKSIVELSDYNILLNDSGKLELKLSHGELIPTNSILTIENQGNYYEFNLSDVISEQGTSGNFFLEGNSLLGNGTGYGAMGEKEILQSVFFKLLIEPPAEEPVEETTTEVPTEEPVEEVPTEEPVEEVLTEEPTVEPTTEISTEEPVEEVPTEEPVEEVLTEEPTPTPITGEVVGGIGEFFKNIFTGNVISEELIIQGDVKKGEDFTYSTNSNNIVSIVENSVKTEEKELPISILNIENNNGEITISTNYSEIEVGFGSDYITEDIKTYSIDLNSLGVHLEAGEIIINVNYNGNNLINIEQTISENITDKAPTINETIEELAEEIFKNQTEILSNFTEIVLTEEEKVILRQEFKLIVVNITAENYRDKVIVNFNLGEYTLSNSYSENLSNEDLKELIERDRIIFMKDLARELSKEKYSTESRTDLDLLFPVM